MWCGTPSLHSMKPEIGCGALLVAFQPGPNMTKNLENHDKHVMRKWQRQLRMIELGWFCQISKEYIQYIYNIWIVHWTC